MRQTIQHLAISASVIASAVVTAPAFALSLTGATIGGTAASDYYVYGVSGNQTVLIPSTLSNAISVLDGNATSPTGNVELRASSELAGFDFSKYTSLTGKIGGMDITLSSLTQSDWNTVVGPGSVTLGQQWFNQALTANNVLPQISTISTTISSNLVTNLFTSTVVTNLINASSLTLTQKNALIAQLSSILPTLRTSLQTSLQTQLQTQLQNQLSYNNFVTNGGQQRFSDPNISYVNQDQDTGLISIGLAGHYNATNLIVPSLSNLMNGLSLPIPNSLTIGSYTIPIPSAVKTNLQNQLANQLQTQLQTQLQNTTFQASELVKYTYNGKTDYLYSFHATQSGLTNTDRFSHTGNYEVTLVGVPPAKTPEASSLLGLMAIGSLLVVGKRKA